jgi:hypothetical protein
MRNFDRLQAQTDVVQFSGFEPASGLALHAWSQSSASRKTSTNNIECGFAANPSRQRFALPQDEECGSGRRIFGL